MLVEFFGKRKDAGILSEIQIEYHYLFKPLSAFKFLRILRE
jgi:hypothetical protein